MRYFGHGKSKVLYEVSSAKTSLRILKENGAMQPMSKEFSEGELLKESRAKQNQTKGIQSDASRVYSVEKSVPRKAEDRSSISLWAKRNYSLLLLWRAGTLFSHHRSYKWWWKPASNVWCRRSQYCLVVKKEQLARWISDAMYELQSVEKDQWWDLRPQD